MLALLAVKGALLWLLGRWISGLSRTDALRLSALLACGGEFAFVVLRQATEQGLIETAISDTLTLAITVSMALTPLLVLAVAMVLNRAARDGGSHREFDAIDTGPPKVIIAGFGRMGQIVGRVLRAQRIPFVALESSVDQVEFSRRFGSVDLYFGDPSRVELLRAAQADKAEVFVLTADDPEVNLRIAELVRREFPNLKIVARARNRQHAFRLLDLGIAQPVRETFYSSLKMTRQTLELLGLSPAYAADRVERFRRHDDQLLQTQAQLLDDEGKLVQSAQEALVDLQDLFEADAEPRAEHEREKMAVQGES